MRLVVQVQMLGYTGLTERHLVRHAEGVNHRVVFIAKEHSGLLGRILCWMHHLWRMVARYHPARSTCTMSWHFVTHLKLLSSDFIGVYERERYEI